ncbi:MAG: GNAT family N-acetyltransferase [Planctomycetota bacterium]|jgi:GNAT superfamily N-acetyltransferase|nr:GNAT family N-acetyltransferase [Planctomycetota bacterium]MDP7131398.1 GNAT family N-acetyltransferase [Planctomycetota bacterium]MDP7252894.1 GNAT family N-acetyltransferase [Planctomycetota bacterium]
MEDITIREMGEEDCPQVSRLQCASFEFGAERAGFGAAQIADYFLKRGSEEAIKTQFHAYHCLVACGASDIVGVIGIKDSEITKLYVDPSHLGQGIGTSLFAAASEIIAQSGHQDLWLGTIFPATLPFYQAMGMSESGRKTVGFGPMVGAESILLKKALHCSEEAEQGAPVDC